MSEVASEKKTNWKVPALLILGVWYLFGRNGGDVNGTGVTEFRGLNVNYEGIAGSEIIVNPESTWGGTLRFEHKGAGRQIYVGIGFAYGEFIGHGSYFIYAVAPITVPDALDWTPYEVKVQRVVGPSVDHHKLIDCHKFLANSLPVAGGTAADPYGLNDWDDEVYVVKPSIVPTAFRELDVSYIGEPTGEGVVWSFPSAGTFGRSYPLGTVILNDLINVPPQVDIVWNTGSTEYWIPTTKQGALKSFEAGQVYYVVVSGPCEWRLPAPSGATLSEINNLELCYL